MRRASVAAAFFFLLLCAAWYVRDTVVMVVPYLGENSDFKQYYMAAQNVVAGHSPFTTRGYIYPPLLAWLLTPLAPMTYLHARWFWFAVSQLCLFVAAWLIWRAGGRSLSAACCIALVWSLGGAAWESLGIGQPGPELALLIAMAIVLSGSKAAAALGTGVALKVYPGVLAATFVIRRRWRELLICAGAAALLIVLPWGLVVCCLDGPKTPGATDTWSGTPAPLSWGFPSVALRLLDPPKQAGPLPPDWATDLPYLRLPVTHRIASIGAAAVTMLAGLCVFAAALGRKLPAIHEPFAMAALVSLSLAASPVCWTHYQVVEYPGVALLLCHATKLRRWALSAAVVLLGGLLYPIPVAVLDNYYMKYGTWTASLPTLYFWTSVAPFASVALFALFVREAKGASAR